MSLLTVSSEAPRGQVRWSQGKETKETSGEGRYAVMSEVWTKEGAGRRDESSQRRAEGRELRREDKADTTATSILEPLDTDAGEGEYAGLVARLNDG